MAKVLAGESRNTRDTGGFRRDGSDRGVRPAETSFIGAILLGSLKVISRDYIQSEAAILGISSAVKDKIPFRVRPMLATLVGEPFQAYEEKYDGIRILAHKEGSRVTLLSRNDNNRTESSPAVARAIGALRPTTCCLMEKSLRSTVTRFHASSFYRGESVVLTKPYSTVCM
ncbi:MAG: hypothetical protein WB660_03255 [Candidatus Sulfotelmatobacter sp.]